MGIYGGTDVNSDPQVGEASKMSAQTGRDYLDWMKNRAVTTDKWAAQDRARAQDVYAPMEDRFIADAKSWDSPTRQATAARTAAADVSSEFARSEEQSSRQLASMGVNPRSGRSVSTLRARGIEKGLMMAGATNAARAGVRAQGLEMRSNAINMGKGLAVNPLQSFTAGTSAGSSGFSGAMSGYGQQASILQNQQQLNQAGQQDNGLASALGMGTSLLFMSSDEDVKIKKRRSRGVLDQVRKMRVDDWEYKPDAPGGDGGGIPHTGTYAQDFAAATGKGDGKKIAVVDAVGVNLGAVKEVDANVQKLDRRLRGIEKGIANMKKVA